MGLRYIHLPKDSVGETNPVPPPKRLPIKGLAMWKKLPYDAKHPHPGRLKRDFKLVTKEIGKSLIESYPNKSFDLSLGGRRVFPASYNSLHDPHLRHHFLSAPSFRHLVKRGLVTLDGKVKTGLAEYNQYRMYLYSIWAMHVNQLLRNQEIEENKRLKSLLEAVEKGNSFSEEIMENQDDFEVDAVLSQLTAKVFRNNEVVWKHISNPLVRSIVHWQRYQNRLLNDYKNNYPAIRKWLDKNTRNYKLLMEKKINAIWCREKNLRARWEKLEENSRASYDRVVRLQGKQRAERKMMCENRYNQFKEMWAMNGRVAPHAKRRAFRSQVQIPPKVANGEKTILSRSSGSKPHFLMRKKNDSALMQKYKTGVHPPNRKTKWIKDKCQDGMFSKSNSSSSSKQKEFESSSEMARREQKDARLLETASLIIKAVKNKLESSSEMSSRRQRDARISETASQIIKSVKSKLRHYHSGTDSSTYSKINARYPALRMDEGSLRSSASTDVSSTQKTLSRQRHRQSQTTPVKQKHKLYPYRRSPSEINEVTPQNQKKSTAVSCQTSEIFPTKEDKVMGIRTSKRYRSTETDAQWKLLKYLHSLPNVEEKVSKIHGKYSETVSDQESKYEASEKESNGLETLEKCSKTASDGESKSEFSEKGSESHALEIGKHSKTGSDEEPKQSESPEKGNESHALEIGKHSKTGSDEKPKQSESPEKGNESQVLETGKHSKTGSDEDSKMSEALEKESESDILDTSRKYSKTPSKKSEVSEKGSEAQIDTLGKDESPLKTTKATRKDSSSASSLNDELKSTKYKRRDTEHQFSNKNTMHTEYKFRTPETKQSPKRSQILSKVLVDSKDQQRKSVTNRKMSDINAGKRTSHTSTRPIKLDKSHSVPRKESQDSDLQKNKTVKKTLSTARIKSASSSNTEHKGLESNKVGKSSLSSSPNSEDKMKHVPKSELRSLQERKISEQNIKDNGKYLIEKRNSYTPFKKSSRQESRFQTNVQLEKKSRGSLSSEESKRDDSSQESSNASYPKEYRKSNLESKPKEIISEKLASIKADSSVAQQSNEVKAKRARLKSRYENTLMELDEVDKKSKSAKILHKQESRSQRNIQLKKSCSSFSSEESKKDDSSQESSNVSHSTEFSEKLASIKADSSVVQQSNEVKAKRALLKSRYENALLELDEMDNRFKIAGILQRKAENQVDTSNSIEHSHRNENVLNTYGASRMATFKNMYEQKKNQLTEFNHYFVPKSSAAMHVSRNQKHDQVKSLSSKNGSVRRKIKDRIPHEKANFIIPESPEPQSLRNEVSTKVQQGPSQHANGSNFGEQIANNQSQIGSKAGKLDDDIIDGTRKEFEVNGKETIDQIYFARLSVPLQTLRGIERMDPDSYQLATPSYLPDTKPIAIIMEGETEQKNICSNSANTAQSSHDSESSEPTSADNPEQENANLFSPVPPSCDVNTEKDYIETATSPELPIEFSPSQSPFNRSVNHESDTAAHKIDELIAALRMLVISSPPARQQGSGRDDSDFHAACPPSPVKDSDIHRPKLEGIMRSSTFNLEGREDVLVKTKDFTIRVPSLESLGKGEIFEEQLDTIKLNLNSLHKPIFRHIQTEGEEKSESKLPNIDNFPSKGEDFFKPKTITLSFKPHDVGESAGSACLGEAEWNGIQGTMTKPMSNARESDHLKIIEEAIDQDDTKHKIAADDLSSNELLGEKVNTKIIHRTPETEQEKQRESNDLKSFNKLKRNIDIKHIDQKETIPNELESQKLKDEHQNYEHMNTSQLSPLTSTNVMTLNQGPSSIEVLGISEDLKDVILRVLDTNIMTDLLGNTDRQELCRHLLSDHSQDSKNIPNFTLQTSREKAGSPELIISLPQSTIELNLEEFFRFFIYPPVASTVGRFQFSAGRITGNPPESPNLGSSMCRQNDDIATPTLEHDLNLSEKDGTPRTPVLEQGSPRKVQKRKEQPSFPKGSGKTAIVQFNESPSLVTPEHAISKAVKEDNHFNKNTYRGRKREIWKQSKVFKDSSEALRRSVQKDSGKTKVVQKESPSLIAPEHAKSKTVNEDSNFDMNRGRQQETREQSHIFKDSSEALGSRVLRRNEESSKEAHEVQPSEVLKASTTWYKRVTSTSGKTNDIREPFFPTSTLNKIDANIRRLDSYLKKREKFESLKNMFHRSKHTEKAVKAVLITDRKQDHILPNTESDSE